MAASSKAGSALLRAVIGFAGGAVLAVVSSGAITAREETPSAAVVDQATIDAHADFVTADRCMACHNGIVTAEGEPLSFGLDWKTSMMANSARDPYWQAGVRREVIDHPESKAAIENECSRCHMPMTNVPERAAGGLGRVFAHLPVGGAEEPGRFAHDGVSCTVCHRIEPSGLGSPDD